MNEKKRMAIDYHCNLFTPEAVKRKYVDPFEGKREYDKFGRHVGAMEGYEVDDFLERMDGLGMVKGITPAWQWRSYLDGTILWDDSPELIYDTLVKTHPDRFHGLFGINPYYRMDGVRHLEKAVKEYGFVGAHLHTHGFGLPINDRAYFPFYAKCEELDVVAVIMVGAESASQPAYLGEPKLLDDVAIYFPRLRIVASHTGWPWVEEAINLAFRHENVVIGTAGYTPKYWPANLVHYINSWGKGKVMWGTSFPLVDHEKSLEQIDELGLRDDAKHELLYGTASRVFRI
ncbi:MAG: amidohydrolase family protein [Deltaproteobacteria bacterium]|nr:amidohydrolase family protein [Deltaproteobacteria bacterium]